MAWPAAIQAALQVSGGARFYKCALQVNPYQYLLDNGKPTAYTDEASYNTALVRKLVAEGIEVAAVTDHYRVKSSVQLTEAMRAAAIAVLPGFEAVAKDGVHFLCLFDPTKDSDAIERVIGACGVHGSGKGAVGALDSAELLEKGREWGAVFIAAHTVAAGGLLTTLKGTSRANVWRSDHLLACSLAGPVQSAPENHRRILSNTDPAYHRERPIAVINAQDVCSPDDLDRPSSWCWIKASELSIEGLRQAFLDPGSRVRLGSERTPDPHTEFLAIAWEGGFLDGVGFRFNENLNSLIGGRGSGKSTVVESIRAALGMSPLGEEAKKAYQGIVRNVLRDGTKVSLLVRSHTPSPQDYLIERTFPRAPVVRDSDGSLLAIAPSDVIPSAEVYGQHEIGELARSPEKLTVLLRRFIVPDEVRTHDKATLRTKLGRSRSAVINRSELVGEARTKLARLPALQERLRRYEAAGVEARLKERSQLVTEQRILTSAASALDPFRGLAEAIRAELPIGLDFVSETKVKGLPGASLLREVEPVLSTLGEDLEAVAKDLDSAIARADSGIETTRTKWDGRKKVVQEAFDKVLRELQATKIDAKDFLEIRTSIEELVPVRDGLPQLEAQLSEAEAARRQLIADWEDAKTAEFRDFDRAAARVSRQLEGRVRVRVAYAGDREPLLELLRSDVGGRLSETIEILKDAPQLSVASFADAWRKGAAELVKVFGIPQAQADRIAAAGRETILKAEELELQHTTQIELNLSPMATSPNWQRLDDLSTGQKATAVLLLLLLESEAPLVVDQPEDDLDNRFITESIVPTMRDEKRRRQFVFATHNANIPVLGDAELIVGLEATGEAITGRGSVRTASVGSIDNSEVRDLTEELLEGGRTAFEMRRLKYGF